MYFISDKCVVGKVGSYCQLAVTFLYILYFLFRLTKPDNVVPQFILTPHFHKSRSAPGNDNKLYYFRLLY